MRRLPAFALAVVLPALVLAACATGESGADSSSSAPSKPKSADSSTAKPSADEPVAKEAWETVPLEQLVGELIMTKLVGPTATAEELQAIRRLQVGGIILFGPSVVDEAQLRALLTSLDDAREPAATRVGLEPRLLISVDQEGGDIRNVPFAPPEEAQPSLASGSTGHAREVAADTGSALRALGISMDLGPVADLAMGPNRTMAGRAFGEDPAVVAPFVRATVEGLQSGGVAAVAKHFPGFGASSANSDEDVAYVDRSASELAADELVPFRAAIDAQVDAVMISHGIFRQLGSKLPASIEPKIATTLLRDQLGFEGVAMTDSMNAKGFRDAWGDTIPRACPVAIKAGIDLLLLTGSMETARSCRDRILDAVADGTLPEARVREAARRVIELRRRRAPAATAAPAA
jgi:beta-N-acetylhexosaminidase